MQQTFPQRRSPRALLVPVVGLVAALTLAGCTFGAPAPTAQQTVRTNEGNVNISTSGNNVSFTGESNNTQFSFGSGLPSTWPSDLPTPRDATVAFAGSETEDGQVTHSASFTLPSTSDASSVLGELKAAFQASGWTVSDETSGSFGITVGGFEASKGQQSASVAFIGISGSANAAENGATLTISAEYPQ